MFIKRSNSVILTIASLVNGSQLFKERICSCRSKFFPVRVDTFSEGFQHSGKQTGSHKGFLFFLKRNDGKKMVVHSCHHSKGLFS